MDGSWVRTTTTKLHKSSATGACVTVDTANTKCFNTSTNLEVSVTGTVQVNALTGRCVDVSTNKCQDGDAAVATSATKGRNPDTNVCVTLVAGKCAGSDGAGADPSSTQALDSNFSCRAITATQCWDEAATPAASSAVSALKSLHTVTKVCVAGAAAGGQCFESNA